MTPFVHPARALACSPRGGGNTDTATALFAQGFTDAGGRIEVAHLRTFHVAPCVSCQHCERSPEGACPLARTDNSASLFDMLLTAPTLFIAAPIYFYHLPAHLKAFIDRGQSHWIRRTRGDSALESLPRRTAWVTLVAGRKQGDRLFEGSLITLRYFLRIFNFDLAPPLTLPGCDDAASLGGNTDLAAQVHDYGAQAARLCPSAS